MKIKKILELIKQDLIFQREKLNALSDKDHFRHLSEQYLLGKIHALKDLAKKIQEQAE